MTYLKASFGSYISYTLCAGILVTLVCCGIDQSRIDRESWKGDNIDWTSMLPLYFENMGELNFKVHQFEQEPTANWLFFDIADIDHDKDMDIIVAANKTIHGLLNLDIQSAWSKKNIGVKVYYNESSSKEILFK